MAALVFVEHNGVDVLPATLKAVTAARSCAEVVHLLVAGQGDAVRAVAAAAQRIAGISTVLLADDPAYTHFLAEPLGDLVARVGREYTHIFAAATTCGKNFMPRVAALLDVAQISEICAVAGPDTFVRPIYAGNALATVKALDPIKVVTVRATAFPAAAEDGSRAELVALPAGTADDRSSFQGQSLSESARPELTGARGIVTGGRGMGSADNFRMLEALADRLGGAVGASRAAVDAGFAPNDRQVGQTGKIVAPELYIAVGVSGAIQHLAGMKDSKVIVAINKDEEAPIFQVADYGLVGDLFQLVPEWITELDERGA